MTLFKRLLHEAKSKPRSFLKSIPKMDGDVYVFIMGGSASGKNYIYDMELNRLPLVDVDAYVKELSKGDFDKARKFVSSAIHMVNKDIDQKIVDRQSFAQTGTGANFKGVYNRIKKIKDAGYTVIVVLVETTVENAIERNKQRVASGGHGKTLESDKIERTKKFARETFETLKKNKIVDYTVEVQN